MSVDAYQRRRDIHKAKHHSLVNTLADSERRVGRLHGSPLKVPAGHGVGKPFLSTVNPARGTQCARSRDTFPWAAGHVWHAAQVSKKPRCQSYWQLHVPTNCNTERENWPLHRIPPCARLCSVRQMQGTYLSECGNNSSSSSSRFGSCTPGQAQHNRAYTAWNGLCTFQAFPRCEKRGLAVAQAAGKVAGATLRIPPPAGPDPLGAPLLAGTRFCETFEAIDALASTNCLGSWW
jgi:hypothetical protein